VARNRRVRKHRRHEEEECEECNAFEDEDIMEFLEHEAEYYEDIEDEADPWLWMEEYDGYDEDSYSDEPYGDDP
jgi:hypothetical protein